MSGVFPIAMSGVQAASARMDVAAHNIANSQTERFQRQVVNQQSQESGGVSTSVAQAQEVGAELATDLVEQRKAAYSYRANLRSIQTQEKMMGSLLDVRA